MTGFNPQKVQKQVKKHWEENNVKQRVRESTEGNEPFFLIDGPPYLNGAPHVGHMQGKVLKDVYMRYKQMQGHDVWDQAGFDTHGLPNELATEKELGLENKDEIGSKISASKFIEECKERATSAQDLWRGVMWDLGIWQDFEDPYLTYEPSYMESEWWLVSQAEESGLLYRDKKPIHWCSRCKTSLSGYEVTDEYKTVEDNAVYAKFDLENRDEKLVIWTTTPWTIPANMIVFVHPDYRYSVVETNEERLIVAEQLVEEVMDAAGIEEYSEERTLTGSDLKGLEYTHPLEENVPHQQELEQNSVVHTVNTSEDLVTLEEGTGLVHAATGHGQEDYEQANPLGVPVFSPVNDNGDYTEKAGKYEGLNVHEADETIIQDLREQGNLLLGYSFEHEYPHCWRCGSKLTLRATQQWFIDNTEVKQKMLSESEDTDWMPGSAEKKFKNFVEESPDWCISRQNYWGTPVPIWENQETGEYKVIGSFDELEEEAGELPEDFDPHKDTVDDITWEDEDGNKWKRIPDVLDVWFDSGSAPFASLHYPFEDEPFESMFPMDFITEASDQIRGWFYSLMFCGILGFDRAPYEKVLYQGHVLDSEAKKMSKSVGNVIDPQEQVEDHGSDLTRFYSVRATPPWEQTQYDETEIENEIYRVLSVLWNTSEFLDTYTDPGNRDSHEEAEENPEDRWLKSRINRKLNEIPGLFDKGQTHKIARGLEEFIIQDLSRWYLKGNRDRIKQGDKAAVNTLRDVLDKTVRAMAPFTPFICEQLYKGEKFSVHVEEYPSADEAKIKPELETSVETIQEIVRAASSIKSKNQYNERWPVNRMIISTEHEQELRPYADTIKSRCNLENLEFGDVSSKLSAKPDYSSIGPKFGEKADEAAEIIENLEHGQIEELENGLNLKADDYEIAPEDVKIKSETEGSVNTTAFSKGEVHLDLSMSEHLEKKAALSELKRSIQEERKQRGLDVEDEIELKVEETAGLEGFEQELKESVGAASIKFEELTGHENAEFKQKKIGFRFSETTQ